MASKRHNGSAAQVFSSGSARFLDRAGLLVRYGVTHQRLNGWRCRALRPLPDPAAAHIVVDDHGSPHLEPLWHIFELASWEVDAIRAARAHAERARVRAIIAMYAAGDRAV